MAVRTVLQIGDPRLKEQAKTVAIEDRDLVNQLVGDLKDTMQEAGLVGIAAPQIGAGYRMFVTEPRETPTRSADQTDELRVYINPQIVWESEEQVEIYEGCGSVLEGKLFGPVERPREITIEAFDINGKKFRLTCDGLLARVILHEYDHLEGIEFTEKVSDYSKLMSYEHYIQQIKNRPEEVALSKLTKKELVWS